MGHGCHDCGSPNSCECEPLAKVIVPLPKFEPFPKIPRLRRGCVVTEKIDGSNAGILVPDDSGMPLLAAKRSGWAFPGKATDNFGFAAWVQEHDAELRALGPGMHWGEWWGQGIQRRYGLEEKRFSLFNTARWNPNHPPPACCRVVPFLGGGPFTDGFVQGCLERLRTEGSLAEPGWMKPEGVVVFHPVSRNVYKVLLENDDAPKGEG